MVAVINPYVGNSRQLNCHADAATTEVYLNLKGESNATYSSNEGSIDQSKQTTPYRFIHACANYFRKAYAKGTGEARGTQIPGNTVTEQNTKKFRKSQYKFSRKSPYSTAMETAIRPLTPSQLKVLLQLSFGQTNNEIAKTLGISRETVKRHLTSIFQKTGVKSRLQLMLWAQETDVWK